MLSELAYKTSIIGKVKNKNFTIISSNCWGGSVYEDTLTRYTTPTVGLFFNAPCYITFLKDLEKNLNTELKYVKTSKYPEANIPVRGKLYPIGSIGESEIHFQHHDTFEQAKEKWDKRKKRVNLDNLFISFSDRDHCTEELIREFDNLPFENKVCLTAREYKNYKSVVWLKDYSDKPFVGDLYNERHKVRKYFDVIKWLNSPLESGKK